MEVSEAKLRTFYRRLDTELEALAANGQATPADIMTARERLLSELIRLNPTLAADDAQLACVARLETLVLILMMAAFAVGTVMIFLKLSSPAAALGLSMALAIAAAVWGIRQRSRALAHRADPPGTLHDGDDTPPATD